MTQPAGEAPAVETPAVETPAAPAAETTWTSGLSEEHVGFLGNKAFDEPGKLITAYQQLEGMRGVPAERLLKIPADNAEPEEWAAYHVARGVPEKADGYDFGEPQLEEGQEDLTPWFREAAHKAHLTNEDAMGLITSLAELQQKQATDRTAAIELRDQTGMDRLKEEWGTTYDERIQMGDAAAKALGWDGEVFDLLSREFGEDWIRKEVYKLGAGMREPTFAGDKGGQGGAGKMSPGEAQAKVKELRSDTEWMDKWNKGDQAKVKEMSGLLAIANPATAEATFDPVLDTRGGPPRR